MSEWFELGMKVVCVDDEDQDDLPPPYIVKGRVYTIARVYTTEGDPVPMLEFVELPALETDEWYPGFDSTFFRPLRKRKTSIEVFQRLLKTEKVEVKA